MKKLFVTLICLALYACPVNHAYGPNNISESGLSGRVENIEDALLDLKFEIKNVTLENIALNNYKFPVYELKLNLEDTIIDYRIELRDCQGFRELIIGSNWDCDYSNINILSYRSNVGNLPFSAETDLFREHVVPKIEKILEEDSTKYTWNIIKNKDSILVKTLNQNQIVRREQVYRYVKDTIYGQKRDSILILIKIRNFGKDSVHEYVMDKNYYYLRIAEINTMPNNGYSK